MNACENFTTDRPALANANSANGSFQFHHSVSRTAPTYPHTVIPSEPASTGPIANTVGRKNLSEKHWGEGDLLSGRREVIIDWLVVQGSRTIDRLVGRKGREKKGKKTKNEKAHVGFPKVGGGILGQRS